MAGQTSVTCGAQWRAVHRVQWKQLLSTGVEGGVREGEGALGAAVWGAAVSVAPAEGEQAEGGGGEGGGGQDSSVKAGGLGGSVQWLKPSARGWPG